MSAGYGHLVKLKFEEVKIGMDIPDETFSFEGMGVPIGTMIADKRAGGSPILSSYRKVDTAGLEQLNDIIQSEIDKNPSQVQTATTGENGLNVQEFSNVTTSVDSKAIDGRIILLIAGIACLGVILSTLLIVNRHLFNK